MNFAALVLRISKVTERFPRFHKIARRAYCVFRPGIRFQTEAAFKDYQDIFVLKIGANDGITSDPLATLLLADAISWALVEPHPDVATMLGHYGSAAVLRLSRLQAASSHKQTCIAWTRQL
jgi:hypothetical protein